MKKIKLFLFLVTLTCCSLASAQGNSRAKQSEPQLRFSAINAGYTDANKVQQNYDFIELAKVNDGDLALSDIRVIYTNSKGNVSGEITFSQNAVMTESKLILGSKYAPQYKHEASDYIYNFGNTGLASTAGMLSLWDGNVLLDEVCWGNLACKTPSWVKFASDEEDNMSMYRNTEDGNWAQGKYYPSISPSALRLAEEVTSETPEGTEIKKDGEATWDMEEQDKLNDGSCLGLVFSEIYTYFENDYSEQFVELHNAGEETIRLDQCILSYKNKEYPLEGELAANHFFVFRDPALKLTKNPSRSNELVIKDQNGNSIDTLIYYSGQKKGRSYAMIDEGDEDIEEIWAQSYHVTPGEKNSYQEFRSCAEGKIINPSTGNCIKADEEEPLPDCPEGKFRNPETGRCKSYETLESILAPCEDGYYRNPETNRCKKLTGITSGTTAPCDEGYERNPETGRCKKIKINEGADYPVIQNSYDNPSSFIAYGALGIIAAAGVLYVVFQFRQEIWRKFKKLYKTKLERWRIFRKLPILLVECRDWLGATKSKLKDRIEIYGKKQTNTRH